MRRARDHWPEQPTELTLRLDLEPEPERRHRSRVAFKGTKAYVQTYPDPRSRNWREAAVGQLLAQAAQQRLRRPFCGPVRLWMILWLPRPASYPRYVTRAYRKPDWDNLAKSTQDALVDAGIFFDDGIVDDARVRKRYADVAHPPGIDILVWADPPQTAATP